MTARRLPLWLKVASVSGFLVSVVAGFFTLIPITNVSSPLMFAVKIIVVVVVVNVIGVVLYRVRKAPVQNTSST